MKKILVIDDDLSIRRLVGLHLKNAGYEVIFASDGDDGFQKCIKEEPDLILLYLHLLKKKKLGNSISTVFWRPSIFLADQCLHRMARQEPEYRVSSSLI